MGRSIGSDRGPRSATRGAPRHGHGGRRPGAQVADGLAVGTEQAVLGVSEIALAAKCPDDALGPCKVSSGHRREEVVLDLVVKTAEHEVGEPATSDVAGGDHLTP